MNKDLLLKKGDKVTYLKNNDKREFIVGDYFSGETINFLEIDGSEVLKVERPVKYETIYEVKEILDKAEKEYLGAVIKPFRTRAESIVKEEGFDDEHIAIKLEDDCITLPYFKKNTMYKGMKLNKEYTLEELGLWN